MHSTPQSQLGFTPASASEAHHENSGPRDSFSDASHAFRTSSEYDRQYRNDYHSHTEPSSGGWHPSIERHVTNSFQSHDGYGNGPSVDGPSMPSYHPVPNAQPGFSRLYELGSFHDSGHTNREVHYLDQEYATMSSPAYSLSFGTPAYSHNGLPLTSDHPPPASVHLPVSQSTYPVPGYHQYTPYNPPTTTTDLPNMSYHQGHNASYYNEYRSPATTQAFQGSGIQAQSSDHAAVNQNHNNRKSWFRKKNKKVQ